MTAPTQSIPANRPRASLHPLVAAAAVAIIVMCSIGAAAVLGWLPGTAAGSATNNEQAATAPASGAAHEAALAAQTDPAQANRAPIPAPTPIKAPPSSPSNRAPSAPVAQPSPTPRPAPQCSACGVVQGSRSVQVPVQDQSDHLIGTIAGGVTGGVVGNQFGGGNGKSALTVLGAVGGALAGREIERNIRQQQTVTHYELTVRMSDGSTRQFRSAQPFAYAPGAPVRVENDQLLPG